MSRADVRSVAVVEGETSCCVVLEFEFRIAREALVDLVMHRIEVAADLETVDSHRIPWRKGVVVAQLEAALIEFLGRAVAAETAAALEIQSDEVGTQWRRIPTIFLKAQGRFIERVAVVPLMARRSAVNPVPQIGR